jgi:lipoprotein-anchoring transpeptidase ErfK/SrfK
MRALVLLLLAAAVAWGVFWFFPSVQAAEDSPEATGPRFIQPTVPTPAPAAAPAAAPSGTDTPRRETGGPAPRGAGTSPFAADRSAASPRQDAEADRLAQLVLHGSAAQVEAFRIEQAKRIAGDPATIPGLDAHERHALSRALGLRPAGSPSGVPPTALGRAFTMALLAAEAGGAERAANHPAAARALSRLLLLELGAGWPANRAALRDWTDRLDAAQAHHRWNRHGDWPHLAMEVEPGESLTFVRQRALAQRPDLVVCTGLIERASGYPEGATIHPGDPIRVPTETVQTLVDLEARWVLYLIGNEVAAAWECAIGAPNSPTTPGIYEVGEKNREPTWFKRGQEPVVYGDPRNPLGTVWMGWERVEGGGESLGYHGTWEPESVGTAASDGCIRFRNEDAEELFRILPRGTRITVR